MSAKKSTAKRSSTPSKKSGGAIKTNGNGSAPAESPDPIASAAHQSGPTSLQSRPDDATLREWYELMHLGRLLDDKAANYLKQAKGWSYHAPCAGHEGIQLALGRS